MEHKYIDADALIAKIRNEEDNWDLGGDYTAFHFLNALEDAPAADAEPVSVWEERVNKALAEIKEIRLCDILHGHGACGGCGDDDWVCIASKIENIVSKMDGGSE